LGGHKKTVQIILGYSKFPIKNRNRIKSYLISEIVKKVIDFLGYNYWDDCTQSLANRCLLYRIEQVLSREELGKEIYLSVTIIERIEKGNNLVFISFSFSIYSSLFLFSYSRMICL